MNACTFVHRDFKQVELLLLLLPVAAQTTQGKTPELFDLGQMVMVLSGVNAAYPSESDFTCPDFATRQPALLEADDVFRKSKQGQLFFRHESAHDSRLSEPV